MKISTRSFRCLAALLPLTLGVALNGCGGLLGSLDGEGGQAPTPTQQTFTLQGQAYVEDEVASRAFTAGDDALTISTISAAPLSANVAVSVGTPTFGADGAYTLPITITGTAADVAAARAALWRATVAGTAGGQAFVLGGNFVPSAGTVQRDLNATTTLLIPQIENASDVTQAGIDAAEDAVQPTVRANAAVTSALFEVAVAPTSQSEAIAALNSLVANIPGPVQTLVQNALAAAATSVRLVDANGTALASGMNFRVGSTVTVTAEAQNAEGVVLPGVPATFSSTNDAVVSVAPVANTFATAILGAEQTGTSQVSATVRTGVVAQVTLNVVPATHPQIHIQGGAVGN